MSGDTCGSGYLGHGIFEYNTGKFTVLATQEKCFNTETFLNIQPNFHIMYVIWITN